MKEADKVGDVLSSSLFPLVPLIRLGDCSADSWTNSEYSRVLPIYFLDHNPNWHFTLVRPLSVQDKHSFDPDRNRSSSVINSRARLPRIPCRLPIKYLQLTQKSGKSSPRRSPHLLVGQTDQLVDAARADNGALPRRMP